MLKRNFIIVATIIGIFFTVLVAIQPTKIEARNNANPSATPRMKSKQQTSRSIKKSKNYHSQGTDQGWGANQRKGGITHTDSWNSKTKRKPRPKSIIILDQDAETEVARRKRKRNR